MIRSSAWYHPRTLCVFGGLTSARSPQTKKSRSFRANSRVRSQAAGAEFCRTPCALAASRSPSSGILCAAFDARMPIYITMAMRAAVR